MLINPDELPASGEWDRTKPRNKKEKKIRKLIVKLRDFRHLYVEKKERPSFKKHLRSLDTFLLSLLYKRE